MRSPNKSRSRNKNNRRNNNTGNIVNRVFDSSGPDGRVRGTPSQIIEKYKAFTRDATLAGDRVQAEDFAQHAEHYIRLLAAAQEQIAKEQATRQADHEARQGQRRPKGVETSEGSDNSPENLVETSENRDTDKKPRPKREAKPHNPTEKSNKLPKNEQSGFDSDDTPDFLKAIND